MISYRKSSGWLVMAGLAAVVVLFGAGAAAGSQEPYAGTEAGESHAATEGSAESDQEHAATQEHGDEHATEEHGGPTWGEYAFKWINFFLLGLLLYWALVVAPSFVRENFEFNGLREILGARSQQVLEARDLAQQQQASAASRLAESATRLERVEQEEAALLTDARKGAQRDKKRLVAAAAVDAEIIRDSANRDLDAQVARSRRALQTYVADQAVAVAKRILQDNFSAADQTRLVREHLDSLGETVS